MTKVRLKRDLTHFDLSCKDHATGSEAVCAAATMLCYALAAYLYNICCTIEEIKLEKGDVHIRYKGDDPKCEAAFEMACVGFLSLEASFPDYLKIERAGKETFLERLSEVSGLN